MHRIPTGCARAAAAHPHRVCACCCRDTPPLNVATLQALVHENPAMRAALCGEAALLAEGDVSSACDAWREQAFVHHPHHTHHPPPAEAKAEARAHLPIRLKVGILGDLQRRGGGHGLVWFGLVCGWCAVLYRLCSIGLRCCFVLVCGSCAVLYLCLCPSLPSLPSIQPKPTHQPRQYPNTHSRHQGDARNPNPKPPTPDAKP